MRSKTRLHQSASTSVSAASAYRKDVETRHGPIGKDDGAWIAIATMVGQVSGARGSDRRRILDEAAGMAAGLFEPRALAYGCDFDPPHVDRRSSIAVLRLLAEHVENAGSLNLATSLVEGLRGLLPIDSINAGRVLAHRARLSRKMGQTDVSLAMYHGLRRLARISGSNELLLRSWSGFAAIAQMRGNYPELRAFSRRVVARAEACKFDRLAGYGHQGLMTAFAVACEFDDAIAHGWLAYRFRNGDDRAQVNMLGNIAQLFYDSGHPNVARNAFIRVLGSHPPIHVMAPALGGYALASAATGDHGAVHWAAAESTILSELQGFRYEAASTLLDCALALEAINDAAYASVLRARGSAIAQYGGFHELIMKAESSRISPTRTERDPLKESSAAVAWEISQLPEVAVPDHLELATV